MRVVVTRPAHSGERTASRLAQHGHEAALLPLSRPVHDAAAMCDALSGTRGPIAITSGEAIRMLAHLGPLLEACRARPLFAVGKATGAAAAEAGFTTVFIAETGGRELADIVAASRQAQPGMMPLLYLAGSPRTPAFEARLEELQVPFSAVDIYRMEDIVPDETALRHLFFEWHADVVLLYSRRTAMRFFSLSLFRLSPQVLSGIRLLCLSDAIAEAVPDAFRPQIEVAAVPDEDGLFALLDDG